jgi:hypothetical protein
VNVRTQQSSISASRPSQIGVKLEVKNMGNGDFAGTFVTDSLTVTFNGQSYGTIDEPIPPTRMMIHRHQTFKHTFKGGWGKVFKTISGGAKPAPGIYTFTYVFYDGNGSATNQASFTLKVTA